MGKFLIAMIIIFIGVYFIALITPKLAGLIDKKSGKAPDTEKENPERVQEDNSTDTLEENKNSDKADE